MKLSMKIGNINIAGTKLNDIEFTSEYTVKEFTDLLYLGKKFTEEMLDESPELAVSIEQLIINSLLKR